MTLKNAYRKGYRNEKRSRLLLEREGYAVIEARGSHGVWDMVGIRGGDAEPLPSLVIGRRGLMPPSVRLVQSKTNRGAAPDEMQSMREFAAPAGVRKELHIWYDHIPDPKVIIV